jgi:hypothetical protein
MENCYQNSSWGKGLTKSRNNESYTFHLLFVYFLGQFLPLSYLENDGYLHISFALLYSLLQKRLLTCTLLKLCLTQVLFNKRRMQVKCIYLRTKAKVNLGTRCSLKMSKNMNKRATKRKSATENSMLKFLTVSSVSSDKAIIRYPSDLYALSFEKYKGEVITRNFSKTKMYCYVHDWARTSEFGKFAYTAICMRNVYTLIW